MRTTVDLPDPLYKRAKATAALRGVKLRELFTEALERHLGGGDPTLSRTQIPKVTAADLARYPDADALRGAYPSGYRIIGPLIRSASDAPPILASQIAEIEAQMVAEELDLASHGRPR